MTLRSQRCSATGSCVPIAMTTTMMMVLMMMMMTTTTIDAAALPKSSASELPDEGVSLEWRPLQVEQNRAGNIGGLNNRSISPWTDVVSFDDSRFPSILAEARCSLRGCLNVDGGEDPNLESKPIMRQVLLLRRVRSPAAPGAGPEAGPGAGPGAGSAAAAGHRNYHFRLESRLIAVGCTCVRPSVLPQD